jgi:acyl-CoA hydrolase
MLESVVVPSGKPVIRTIAMPADTNSAGDILGCIPDLCGFLR